MTAELEATGVYTPDQETYVPQSTDSQRQSPPDQIGGYRLLRKIGSGGMGTVYEAEDLASSQRVALKLIKRTSDFSDSATKRFQQEGRLASSISHPRCVFVIAADEHLGQPYIVMELMPGQTLIDLVSKEGPLPVSKAVSLIHDIIEGLQEAHRQGLVHRDVKPANCFIDEQGRAKIGDFGLAKVLEQTNTADAPTAVELTGTGTFVGTPLYAAPEQIKGQQIDQQVDVYAVGATLYYLLSGKAPFEDQQSVTAVLARIVSEDPDPLSSMRKDLPRGLEAVVSKALERDRSRRFRDLESLRLALQAYLPGRTRIVRLGLRVAAYAVDSAISLVVMALAGLMMGIVFSMTDNRNLQEGLDVLFGDTLLSSLLLSFLTQTFFFLLPEMLWSMTIGKWLFRLRINHADRGGKATPGQILVRNLVFLLVLSVLQIVAYALIDSDQAPERRQDDTGSQTAGWRIQLGDPILSNIFGLAVISLTMRRRNGYQGLHEVLSGTRTIWLPAPPPQVTLRLASQASAIPRSATSLSAPVHVGGFTLTHQLWREGESAVLVGRDERLSRTVWLWLRPADQGRLAGSRRSLSRPARWRWLGSGTHLGASWDAFLATSGITLQNMIDQGHTLDWTATYHLLADLSEELHAAQTDQSVPRLLSPAQLWIQQRGSVQWLDVPTAPGKVEENVPTQEQLFHFLGQASRLALEGPLLMASPTLRRAIPVGGYELINKLLTQPGKISSISALQQELLQLSERPFTLTRWARLRSLIAQSIWLIISILLSVSFAGLLSLLLFTLRNGWNQTNSIAEAFKAIVPVATPFLLVAITLGWSAWWRGRWSFGLVGLEVRRFDGAAVEPWRMAWRTLLLIGPLLILQWLVSLAPLISRWQGVIIHWNQVPIVLYFLITLAWLLSSPSRAWQDRLAGTVIVPR